MGQTREPFRCWLGMDQLRRLRQEFLDAGGNPEDFESYGRGHLGMADTGLQDGAERPAECKEMAEQKLKPGTLVEYHCYDARGRNQGMAVLVFD